MFTIDAEARQHASSPINLDSMGKDYITENGIFVFPSPEFWVLKKNLFFLQRNSERKTFESKYIMRPDYLSFDEYETVILSPLLMYVNGVFSLEDFKLNEVIIPKLSFIIEILYDKFPEIPAEELEAINW